MSDTQFGYQGLVGLADLGNDGGVNMSKEKEMIKGIANKGVQELSKKVGGPIKMPQKAAMLVATFFKERDPNTQFRFLVELDGIENVRFREVKGLEWKAQPEEIREGGNNQYKVRFVGQGEFTPLTIKRGFFSKSSTFFNLMASVMDPKGKVQRRTMSVVVLDDAGNSTGRYNLYGAFITKYVGPSFEAKTDEIAFEEIEICYDYFEYIPF